MSSDPRPGIGRLNGVHQPSVPGFVPLARSVARPAREQE
jgi:hypothetical protein